MTPNLNHAQDFLTALDEDSDSFCFQTFDDSDRKEKSLVRQFHGSLGRFSDTLTELNEKGAGIFVAVNPTDGKGCKTANITGIRALFVDLDGAPLAPVQNARPEPQIIVETSPRRYHAYWRVTDCDTNTGKPALQQLIRRFNADPACSNIGRVMRLPGFYHRKADPHMVRVVDTTPGECSLADLGIGLPTLSPVPTETAETSEPFSVISDVSVGSVEGAIERTLPTAPRMRERCVFEFARHLRALMPNATRKQLESAARQWHSAALPKIGTVAFEPTLEAVLRGYERVKSPVGSGAAGFLGDGWEPKPLSESLLSMGYSKKANHLLQICLGLQEKHGDDPFFISCSDAGKLIGMDRSDAAAVLRLFRLDGILEEVKKGGGFLASRYRMKRHVTPA